VTIPVNVVVATFAAVSARASEPATEDAIDRLSGVEGVVVERQVGDGSLGFISSDALSV
jgi:hypothetical protein